MQKEEKDIIDQDRVARYRGRIKNCLRDGNGEYKFGHGGNDFFSYSGPWTQGIREGPGAKFVASGFSEYSGEFKKGEITGSGRRSWTDGRIYEGDFVNGEMHGRGRWANAAGTETYEGDFKDNKRNGFGTLRKGTDMYRGEFVNNQMHGRGTYLIGGECVIESDFRHNLMNGQTKIKWHKACMTECTMVDGYAEGAGYFATEDGSYDFEGGWSRGLPLQSLTAKYLWSDFVKIEPPVDAVVAGKKAAPPKGKPADQPSIPVVVLGDAVNKIVLKASSISLEQATAPVAAVAPVKGKAPAKADELAKPSIPEPELFGVPCERRRRVVATVRKIVNPQATGDLADGDLSPPITIWIRDQTLRECCGDRTRFPPSCTLFMDGDCAGYGSVVSAPPSLMFESSLASAPAIEVLVPAQQTSDDVAAMKIARGTTLSYKLPCHELKKASDSMTYLLDFKVDIATLSTQYRTAMQQTRVVGGGLAGGRRATSSAANSAVNKRGHSHSNSAHRQQGTSGSLGKQYLDLSIMTFNRVYEGVELSTSRLQLVLVVPESSLKRMAKKLAKMAKESVDEGDESKDAVEASSSGDVDIDWTDCVWELRLITVNQTASMTDVKVASEPSPALEADASVGELSRSFSSLPSIGGSSQTQVIVCARWNEPVFLCSRWQSLALTLRSNSYGLAGAEVSPSSKSVVELTVNGAGRLRVAAELRLLSSHGAASGAAADAHDGVLLAWLPEPVSQPAQAAVNNDVANDAVTLDPADERAASPQAPVDAEASATVLESSKTPSQSICPDFTVTVRAGGEHFVGFVKTMAACSEGDRADSMKMTECFEAWRQQLRHCSQPEHRGEEGDESAASVNAAPSAPPHCAVAQSLSTLLVCGSGELSRILIPTSAEVGDYVIEIADGVNEDVVLPEPAADADPSSTSRPTSEVKHASRVVTRIPSSRQVRIRVAASV